MSYSTEKKLRANIAAARIALEWNGKTKLSQAQIDTVRKWSGMGGNKSVLWGDGPIESWTGASENDRKLYPLMQEFYQVLDDNLNGREYRKVVESLKNSILTAYYTPSCIPATFYQVLKKYHYINKMYEPSAGAGIFVTETMGNINVNEVTVYEKDMLTGKILNIIMSGMNIPYDIQIKGFEESGNYENELYDLITSNIPFGQFPVYDNSFDKSTCAKIHNYFFAKGLTKLKEGGILAYLTSNTFLDTVSNKSAREYLFLNSDFISLTVMPDNLMKETGNTEAPSHFLVVRKRSGKTELTDEEKLLIEADRYNCGGTATISMNKYRAEHEDDITIGESKIGKDQYGKPAREVWWDGEISQISSKFAEILQRDFLCRYGVLKPRSEYEKPDFEIPIGKVEKELPGEVILWDDDMWEELPDNIQIPEGKMIWDDQIVDIPKEFDEDDSIDTPELTDEEWKEEERTFSQAALTTPAVQMELIPDPLAKYGLKKSERPIMEAYLRIKETYVELENYNKV